MPEKPNVIPGLTRNLFTIIAEILAFARMTNAAQGDSLNPVCGLFGMPMAARKVFPLSETEQ